MSAALPVFVETSTPRDALWDHCRNNLGRFPGYLRSEAPERSWGH